MTSQVEVAAELVRLAQLRVKTTGTRLVNELARMVVEDEVLELDPELGWLLDQAQSWSSNDALVAALGVNDLVINGYHVDVRPINSGGAVAISRALVGTSYLSHGTLVVEMTGARTGRFAGYIPAATWMAADRECSDALSVSVPFTPPFLAGLAQTLAGVSSAPANGKRSSGADPDMTELDRFVASRAQVTLPRQRQIAERALSDEIVLARLEKAVALWSDGALSRMLSASSVWSARVEQLADSIAPRYGRITRDEIKKQIMRVGEQFGGQPECPAFRKALFFELAKVDVLKRFQTIESSRIALVMDRVMSGVPVVEAVRELVKNRHVFDLAITIKKHRQRLGDFMMASAEEIGWAFNQLALQPAYATHSKDDEAGVESINETLAMLQAGELLEQIMRAETSPE